MTSHLATSWTRTNRPPKNRWWKPNSCARTQDRAMKVRLKSNKIYYWRRYLRRTGSFSAAYKLWKRSEWWKRYQRGQANPQEGRRWLTQATCSKIRLTSGSRTTPAPKKDAKSRSRPARPRREPRKRRQRRSEEDVWRLSRFELVVKLRRHH